ncbi:CAZyme family GH79 [Paecilomyces variotii]|nr:CAZyme family GH79 [Paecilomyces variotii]
MHSNQSIGFLVAALLFSARTIYGLTFAVPSSPPSNASGTLDSAPVGVSFEFFTFPAYIQDVAATNVCLSNLKKAMGTAVPIRIGGTTQDRATYDPSLSTAVNYSVASPTDAPDSLTFGPSFLQIAGSYDGSVTIGLDRRLNNISNTIAAAKVAVSVIPNLYALELGNEPNFFVSSDPIANGSSWTAAADASSQVLWQKSVATALDKESIIQAGVFFGTGSFSVEELVAREGASASYVRSFSEHYYPQSGSTANLTDLMSHSSIVSGVSAFEDDINAASSLDKPFVFGETNSATQGGGGISPTYGAALWILDYVMQAVILGAKQLFFHQGTIGNCQYCWWGNYTMGAPYYGAYMAALSLNGASRIAPLDSGTTSYAAYAIYQNDTVSRILLYNSDYYSSGTRSGVNFTLAGLSTSSSSSTVTAVRLTGDKATARIDQGGIVTVAGQTFENGTCTIQGHKVVEDVDVGENGETVVSVGAAEAVLVYL